MTALSCKYYMRLLHAIFNQKGKRENKMRAWYFATEERKLQYNDNRSIIVGETQSVDLTERPLKLCEWGLHASKRLIDALGYAPGAFLYEVELSGKMIVGGDKIVAEHRTYLRAIDATEILRAFARKQAMINIEKIEPYCNENEYEIILNWLKTGDETLKTAAYYAAYSAANAAADYVAYAAACSAACSAAHSAANSAARSAYSAARSAADSAAYSAADSACSAANAAACSAANEMLTEMILAEFEKGETK